MSNIYDLTKYAACARMAAAEGAVLLRNEGKVLPLAKGTKIALFGRSQFNYYKSGTGSGGMVNVKRTVSILDALEESEDYCLDEELKGTYEAWLKDHPFDQGQGWAAEPWFQKEMPITDEIVEKAAASSDVAVIILGRTAGEDRDNLIEEGSYLLTKEEERMIEKVTGAFEKTVVLLNVGNIMDMKWVEQYKPQAVMYVWQGGQEGGYAVLDVLSGAVPASGKLPDTIAYDIHDYPSTRNYGDPKENIYEEDIYVGYRYFETFAKDKVLYPFGFGLTYTTFEVETLGVYARGIDIDSEIRVKVRVTNTGDAKGKEVVQVYAEKPQGTLGQPARVLVGYGKTKELAPGEEEVLNITFTGYTLASYDDSGVTGHPFCYVLEAGDYSLYVGTDVRTAAKKAVLNVPKTIALQQLREALSPVKPFDRLVAKVTENGLEAVKEAAPLGTAPMISHRNENLPEEYMFTGDKGWKLKDVKDGKIDMPTFIAQLSDKDLCAIVRGEGMCSPKVTPGTAGAFGGVTESLKSFGIPVACCADGPSGIRMDCGTVAFAMPNGTCMASSFNDEIVQELYAWEGLELRRNKVDTLLGPGMNIHRNPLNGRNFEYFSEDPILTGRMAAAQLKGMDRYGVTGTIKHFAGNNQEFKRHFADDVVSERAMREIYLKGFEIAVREGGAYSIMSTYGLINGTYTASNYDLLTRILREEWGFTGIVMTDWWGKANEAPGEAGSAKNTAQMVRAQNDLTMVVTDAESNSAGDNSEEGLKSGIVTRGEMQRTAANICRTVMRFPVMTRFLGIETELDKQLAESLDSEDQELADVKEIVVDPEGVTVIDPAQIRTQTGQTTVFQITTPERGVYDLKLVLRTEGQQPLAQVPMSIFYEKSLMRSITLTGVDTEPQEFHLELAPAFMNRFYLKFYLGLGGMVVDEASITLQESKEEQFKEFAKHFGEN